jgi:hypothetical protein
MVPLSTLGNRSPNSGKVLKILVVPLMEQSTWDSRFVFVSQVQLTREVHGEFDVEFAPSRLFHLMKLIRSTK